MTICIGIRANDGLVIAADAEDSDGYLKIGQQKITTYSGPWNMGVVPPRPELVLGFTGSGDSDYIEAFIDNLNDKMPIDLAKTKVQDFLSDEVHSFYKRHVVPFARSASPPFFDMLIGASFGAEVQLYTTSRSTVKKAGTHAAIGVGRQFALGHMIQLASFEDVRRTEILAAYIVKMTKERIPDCGKFTSILSIHGPRPQVGEGGNIVSLLPPIAPFTYVSYDKIKRWEESFDRRWLPRQSALIRKLIDEEVKRSGSRKSKGPP